MHSDVGAWAISAGSQPKHADEVVSLVRAELAKLVAHGITDDELDVVRGFLTGSYELSLEDTASRMARNGGSLCTRGEIQPVERQVERWMAVTHDDVRRVIDAVFAIDPITVTLGPA